MSQLALAILFVLSSSLSAAAHPGPESAHGFAAAFLHPLSGLDHLLAMVALGFWAGIAGGRALWQWPAAFLCFLLVGALWAQGIERLPVAEELVFGSALIFACLAGLRLRLPNALALALIATAAFAHGHVHGRELALGPSDLGATFGFIAATAALHVLGVLLAYLTSRTEVRALRATS